MDGVMIVTGAGRGIGAAIAQLAGRRGYKVCVNYHKRADRAEQIVASITAEGGKAIAVKADVAEEPDVIRLFSTCDDQLGRVDVLVNNAGIIGDISPTFEVTYENLARMYAVNVFGTILCAREAIRRMSTKHGGKGGAIVNISSIAARLRYLKGLAGYAASKAAIDTFTVGLATEVGPFGVRVNAVRPGLIDTEMHKGLEENFTAVAKTVPLGARSASPDEVAATVLWLVSEEASYVTGAVLDVTGGR